jgi:tripartite-type tricarboxylate transporter receptor subunit TctC
VIAGYPSSANSLMAMEQGETGGFCAWGWVPMKAFRSDWLEEKKFTVLFQIGLRKHPEHPDVPLVTEMANSEEERAVLRLVMAPQKFARPFAAPPDLPKDRAAALRQAFNATVKDSQFLADAEKQQLEIDLVTAEETEQLLAELYNAPPAIIARAKAAME